MKMTCASCAWRCLLKDKWPALKTTLTEKALGWVMGVLRGSVRGLCNVEQENLKTKVGGT